MPVDRWLSASPAVLSFSLSVREYSVRDKIEARATLCAIQGQPEKYIWRDYGYITEYMKWEKAYTAAVAVYIYRLRGKFKFNIIKRFSMDLYIIII